MLAVAQLTGSTIVTVLVALIVAYVVAAVLRMIGVPPPLNWLVGLLVFLALFLAE